jgi:hypothetical protein
MNPHTALLIDDLIPADAPLVWRQASDDVFVATRSGEFAGFVSLDGGEHLLHDGHGRPLGRHATLAAARTALENAAVSPSAGDTADGERAKGPAPRTARLARRRTHARSRIRRALA